MVPAHNPGYGHGHGHVTILNQHYDTIHELRAGNHKISDKHEFRIANEETGLLQVYQPVPRDLSEFGGSPQQQWIVNAIFQGMSDFKSLFDTCNKEKELKSLTKCTQNWISQPGNCSLSGPASTTFRHMVS